AITAKDGAVSIHSGAGNIDLTKGNITAKNDVTLKADKGGITITGTDATSRAEIRSSAGNVSVVTKDAPGFTGLFVNNATLSADNNISIDAVAGVAGARIRGADITATKGHIYLNASAGWGGFDFSNSEQGGLILYGDLLFKAGTGTTINATHTSNKKAYSPPVPLVFEGVNLTFDGGAKINACGSYAGIVLSASNMVQASKSQMFVKNGDVNINAVLDGQAVSGPTGAAGSSASGAIVFNNGYGMVSFELDVDKGSNVTINADSSANKAGSFAAFAAATPESTAAGVHHNGFVFSGGGNIKVLGISDTADAVNLRLFNNENLTGDLIITGTSNSGVGVNFDKYLSTKVSNATITGNSKSGVGVQMTARSGTADLNGNSVSGSTTTGKGGVILSGSNVTISNGKITGNVSEGNGSGVSLLGGSNFVLDGADVIGHAVDGSGISVNGTLAVNNGTQVVGRATGDGDGVVVSGNLTTDAGNGVILDGTASSGDGIKVTGNTALTGAILKGQTDSGSGVNIAGNLTTDSTTQIQGLATEQGTGVTLGASLTGATVHGKSGQGIGLKLADNTVVTGSAMKGESSSGSGVAVTGNISLDDISAADLNASSVNGTGLALENNAYVSTVNSTIQNPVTLTGTSQSGNGVATSGNVSISGVILNGSATTAEGTGATLSGNLTIVDNISGITVNATGNGTALIVDNASINAGGYTSTGKEFVINASISDSGGTAIKTQGNNQLDDITLNGTATNGGTAVQVGGQVSGGHISGMSDTGNGVEIQDEAHACGMDIKGHSGSGAGLNVTGNTILNNTTLDGVSQTGTGSVVSGSVTADEYSVISGEVTAGGGSGVSVSGIVAGGAVTGKSTTGNAVHLTDGAMINDAAVLGTSREGVGIRTEGQVSVSGSRLRGDSLNGTDMVVSGMLSHDADTKIDAETVTGQENIHEVKPAPPPVTDGDDGHSGNRPSVETPSGNDQNLVNADSPLKLVGINSVRLGASNALVTHMNQPAQNGFHSAGTPSVPVKTYQPSEQTVDIRLCDGNECQSESLNAVRPGGESYP
ncbi:TPA: hypothetical protein MND73_004732, partial [Salmonella enterica subsp. houtenae]|nr:hypothetical protein [Salmonella enterica subsp. houtenae]